MDSTLPTPPLLAPQKHSAQNDAADGEKVQGNGLTDTNTNPSYNNKSNTNNTTYLQLLIPVSFLMSAVQSNSND